MALWWTSPPSRSRRLLITKVAADVESIPSRFLSAEPTSTDLVCDLRPEGVPEDLHPNQFFESLLTRAFERLPVTERGQARQQYGGRELPTAEVEPPGGPVGPTPG